MDNNVIGPKTTMCCGVEVISLIKVHIVLLRLMLKSKE